MCSTHAHSLLNASSPTATTSTATSKAVRTHAWTHFSHASSVATPATTSVLLLQQRLKKRAALGRHQGSAQAVVACGSVHLKCAVCCVLCAVCCVLCAVCCVCRKTFLPSSYHRTMAKRNVSFSPFPPFLPCLPYLLTDHERYTSTYCSERECNGFRTIKRSSQHTLCQVLCETD